jgi:hypothetical protein
MSPVAELSLSGGSPVRLHGGGVDYFLRAK